MAEFLAGDRDTQNASGGDWWYQNAPPSLTPQQPPSGNWTYPSGGSPYPIGGPPPSPDAQPIAGVTGPNGEPIYQQPDGSGTAQTSGVDPADETTFGGPVAPYAGMPPPGFTPPPLPDALQRSWQLPTAADMLNTPGYQSRYLQGLDARQRAAAAHGTILNGGTLKALDKYGTDYATQAYQQDVENSLNQRQQASSDYLNLAYGPAWQQNEAAMNQYGALYGQYKDLIANNRNAQNDYWNQQIDLLKSGQGAAQASTPGTAGAQAG